MVAIPLTPGVQAHPIIPQFGTTTRYKVRRIKPRRLRRELLASVKSYLTLKIGENDTN